MTPSMIIASAALVLIAMGFVVVPLFRYRKQPGAGIILAALVLLVPSGVAGIYATVSSYPWGDLPAPQETADAKLPPVDEMITELEDRLKTEPDLEGFMLLGRSYMSLQRYADAVDAWHSAWEMTKGESAEISLNYAEALILADKRTLSTSAADLLDGVLKVMPNEPRALWYGGLSAAARQLNELAVERFTLLMQADLPDNMRKVVQTQLVQLGVAAASVPATAGEQTGQSSDAGVTIAVNIDIAKELAGLVPSGALLFLFARDGDKPGPPLAVKRLPVGEWPLTATLSDKDAMVQGSSIAGAANLKVTARISASGQPIASPGDLYGEATPDKSEGSMSATITIDRIVE